MKIKVGIRWISKACWYLAAKHRQDYNNTFDVHKQLRRWRTRKGNCQYSEFLLLDKMILWHLKITFNTKPKEVCQIFCISEIFFFDIRIFTNNDAIGEARKSVYDWDDYSVACFFFYFLVWCTSVTVDTWRIPQSF